MTEHKSLIGRYYERLEGNDYLELFRYDRTQHVEIQGLKVSHLQGKSHYDVSFKRRNTFNDIGTCSYGYLLNNTFHDVTYHDLITILYASSSINTTSNAEAYAIIGISSIIDITPISKVSVVSIKEMPIISVIQNRSLTNYDVFLIKPFKASLVSTNLTNVNSVLGKTTKAQIKPITTFNSKPVKLAYLVKLIQNTSSIEANANSYVKRVKKKYMICILNKSHNIEVII